MTEFEPQIVAFAALTAYNAADLAGSLRIQYPPAIKVIKSAAGEWMLHVLRAFEDGVDAALVAVDCSATVITWKV
jgi:coenzyme F420-reducing hydrogenase delta subunit